MSDISKDAPSMDRKSAVYFPLARIHRAIAKVNPVVDHSSRIAENVAKEGRRQYCSFGIRLVLRLLC